MWWTGPCFLFDKDKSSTEKNYYGSKETLPDRFTRDFEREIKNVTSSNVEHLPINTMDNIIDIKGHSDVKLFCFTTLVIRLVKNLFRKIKGDNMNSYVDAKGIYNTKVHWEKANQLRLLKSDNYEHLLKNLSLKFDKENITRF